MTSLAEVDGALRGLVDRLNAVDAEVRGRHLLERSVSCAVQDLGVIYTAQLNTDGLSQVTTASCSAAQVRLRVHSDDLVALTEGRLRVTTAWATGRLRVDASMLDLLKLRTLL